MQVNRLCIDGNGLFNGKSWLYVHDKVHNIALQHFVNGRHMNAFITFIISYVKGEGEPEGIAQSVRDWEPSWEDLPHLLDPQLITCKMASHLKRI